MGFVGLNWVVPFQQCPWLERVPQQPQPLLCNWCTGRSGEAITYTIKTSNVIEVATHTQRGSSLVGGSRRAEPGTKLWIDSYQLDSLRPLQRTKRTWVITTIDVQEEDKGPFPKYAGQLFNNKSFNTSVRYLISGPGVDESPEIGLFSIEDDENGHVYVHRPIDREKTSIFQIRFDIVYRKTGEPLDRPLFFKIKVKDINDNAPEFPQEEYSVTIRENHSKDEPVFQVTALDKDEDGTVNSQVSYSLNMQMPPLDGFMFNIDPITGSILLSGCLDYKTATSFKLLIKASDHGTPQLSSTATVNVVIEDRNNHLPVFTSDNYQLQVSAGQEHPAVLRLQVQDEDSPNTPAWRAKYGITTGNEKEQFTIETDPDTNEGILSVIKPLNYEDDSELRLVISVANEEPFFLCKNGIVMISSLESTNATINIKVLQHAPRFQPPILIVQKEDSMKPGRVFRRYLATYPDDVPNEIKYELAHDPAGWLSVDENSGVLTVAKEFDQESPYVNNSVYTIIVEATHHGIPPQTATGTILLYLSDINDRMPTLVAPSLDVCDKKEGTPLMIKAESATVHSHSGPFTFELAEDSEDVKHNWKLGRNFGESVELLMLRSLPQGSYLVPIIIQDGQGFSTRQNQHVRLCFCPDGHTCKDSPLPQAAVGLGVGAIVIILMAFLLLLVSSILLRQFYVPGSKSKAIVTPGEGEQTLINYNEESRMNLSQAKLHVTDHTALPPVSLETGGEVIAEGGLYASYQTFQDRHLDSIMQTVDKILGRKLYHENTVEDYGALYEPHRYAEEGELERSSSFCSVSVGSEDLPADFLNTLGPKFSALEEICEKRLQSFH
ncbi:PREDICTED: cadherin-like protein 26 [Charadrius vociferus]|uniref:cadherin-like protein 26 n=1 Tax=Charadrius vociferus TaxID=50402 RepID=UPI0005217DB7|nr:PREDICTED: cadherin-like protein 26 [Charadrius vociferus]